MIGYLGRRFAGAVLVLLGLSVLVYALFFLAPSDPARLACGKGCTPERLAQVRTAMALDDPAAVQYLHFVRGVVAGRDYSTGPDARHCAVPCLGYSFETDQSVSALLAQRLPVSVSLAVGAEILALGLGIGAGLLAGRGRFQLVRRAVNGLVLVGYAVPVFLVGLALLLLFCVRLRWLPFPTYVPLTSDPAAWAQNLILPWIALALIQAAAYARLTQAGVANTLAEDYVRTARAYGLSERRILRSRALRGALIPVTTLTAIDVAQMMTNAVLTETMFGLPGVGQLLVGAVTTVDLPVVVGVTLLAGCIVIAGNMAADLLLAVVDPRVELR
ncbi:ABC transporter permease [Cryptosporangium phraense]|uniref:ABC transporter permease n=1 Tax=Cryptosporangium phraense TaxID=2593070 RepID=A0A545AXX7_9ACTN|nr:ABC transporter permease [Cryptosporangium phraense]TQS46193.1 ABC transporter permease [Cryptosporangium phraense]